MSVLCTVIHNTGSPAAAVTKDRDVADDDCSMHARAASETVPGTVGTAWADVHLLHRSVSKGAEAYLEVEVDATRKQRPC